MGPAVAKATDWAAVTAWAAWATVAVYVVLGVFAWIQVPRARRVREEQAGPMGPTGGPTFPFILLGGCGFAG